MLMIYKTYVKPSLIYVSEAWKPGTKEGNEKLKVVQKRAARMAGGQGYKSSIESCREACFDALEKELDEADMLRVFRIKNKNNKVYNEYFWTLEEARQGAGRRRFREKKVKQTEGFKKEKLCI